MSVQETIRTILEERLDRKVYDTWCQSLELNEAGENLWHIPAPNPFYRDWLERELRRPLEEAFQQVFGQIPTLVFYLAPFASQRSDRRNVPKTYGFPMVLQRFLVYIREGSTEKVRISGGTDGTRTRDPLRDRQVF